MAPWASSARVNVVVTVGNIQLLHALATLSPQVKGANLETVSYN